MNLDKNTVIGFVLLGILFFAFFWYSNKEQQGLMEIQKRQQDSIARVNALHAIPKDTVAAKKDSLYRDSTSKISVAGNFATAAIGTEQLTVVENEVMKVTFTNKGGRVKFVQLKNYKSYDGSLVQIGNEKDQLSYSINTGANVAAQTGELFFTASPLITNADGSQNISFALQNETGEKITHQYTIKKNDYLIDWNIDLNGADKLLSGAAINFLWKSQPLRHESSVRYERMQSNICFSEGNEFDYISSKNQRKFEKPVQWLSVVQQFFNTTLIAKNSFANGEVQWARSTDSSNVLSNTDASLQLKVPASASVTVPMQLYYGPNDYSILKHQAAGMDKMVNLGRDAYSFVRPINKWFIMPVFDFFAGFVKNFGWVILLLTVFIRLVTSPLTYSSYLSGAKMKVLKPELDALKKKFGTDQQGYAMEQMKLYKEAGVNPLGGCIPALLQIPIFFALYSFFNSNIALRGQSFLWAKDLSSYDVILKLPFNVPMNFGDHISLFTITAVLTSFLISIYNMASTPTQDNPAMKYMPYIFPFMMLFFFNGLPSALTWYYTVSNSLTLILQLIIQKKIIDHDKILAKIDEKRKSPKVKSKSRWQEKYEQMMETQKKVQELKNKTQNKK
ncbi:membrane protein insertase YidC [mine drainage metagenome]|uniref:Membrane protein insertase YidC n=1 Tax=mine drainage metagenome TaxID=410659 RepID=A0A1J5SZY2_9ZZZZ